MEAFLFSLAGMLCFGISNCLWRPLYSGNNIWQVMWKRSAFTVPVMTAIILLFFWEVVRPLTFLEFIRPIPWILLSYLGLIFFTRSLVVQPAGVSGTLILFLGIFGTIVAFIDGSQGLPSYFLLIIVLYLSGFLLIDKGLLLRLKLDTGHLLALAAALSWSIASYGMKKQMLLTGPWVMGCLQEWTVFLLSGLVVLKVKSEAAHPDQDPSTGTGSWPMVVFLALLTIGGVVFTNLSMHRLSLFQIALISMVQPAATMLFGRLVQKERLTFREVTGAVLLMAGAFVCTSQ